MEYMLIKIVTARVSLAAIFVLAITLVAAAESDNLPGTKKVATMEEAVVLKTGIPPIDAAAPANTETATFALG
jgi:hypothetical protein